MKTKTKKPAPVQSSIIEEIANSYEMKYINRVVEYDSSSSNAHMAGAAECGRHAQQLIGRLVAEITTLLPKPLPTEEEYKGIKIKWLNRETVKENGRIVSGPKIEFESPINIENSFTSNALGTKTSTMELYGEMIEWDVNDGEFVENIGLTFTGMELDGYDGVFSLPMQAVMMLRGLGFTVPEEYENT